ncbi:MAG: hypothetical protein ACPGLV_18600, partial [Bacteroidia bacterium]
DLEINRSLHSFLFYENSLKVIVNDSSKLICYALKNGSLIRSFDLKYQDSLNLQLKDAPVMVARRPIRIDEKTAFLTVQSNFIDTSFQLEVCLRDNKFVVKSIKTNKTVKVNLQDNGRFSGYKTINDMLACAKSPNDSLFYWLKYEYKKIEGPIYTNHMPTGRLVLTTEQLFSPYKIDSTVIEGNYDLVYSSAGDLDRYNLQVLNNGNLGFIRNCDHINRTNKRVSHLSYITRPNEFGNLRSRLRSKHIILDTIKRYDYGYYFPISTTHYKKLRFLRAKQCTNELKLFADADSFFQKFEWHVANDTGGFDLFTGKNLRYPSKGRRTFYVKVKGIAKSGYFAWYSDTITFNTQPKAAFTMDTSQWCQWVGLQLKNTSVSEGAKSNSFTWQLLQNDTIKKTYSGKNPYLTFNANGSFDIRLIYNDGICVDTFTRKAAINIIPAPKPVFNVRDSAVCERDSIVVIDKAVGLVSKREYQ